MENFVRFQNALAERRVPALAILQARPVTDKAGRPHVVAGNNALVARLRRVDGADVALRIVTSGDKDHDLPLRYAAIADFQAAHGSAHLPMAIRPLRNDVPDLVVSGSSGFVVAMEWITGPTLLQGIDRAAQAGNVQVLRALAVALTQTWNDLQDLGFTHGDLTAPNLLVRANGQLAVVDLDTTSWEDAPLGPSGTGTPGYRHPTLFRDATLRDTFASLVMLVSLAALADAPELRRTFGDRPTTADGRLLFSARDLADPSTSAAFQAADAHATPPTRALLQALREASMGGVDAIRAACALLPGFRFPMPTSTSSSGWDVGPVIERIRSHYTDTWTTVKTEEAADPWAASWSEADTRVVEAVAAGPAEGQLSEAGWVDAATPGSTAVTGEDIAELKAALSRNDESEVKRLWSQLAHDPLARLSAAEVESVIAAGYDRRVMEEWKHKRDLGVVAVAAEAGDRQIPLGAEARGIVRQAHERTLVRAELAEALATGDRPRLAELAVSGQLVVLGDADRQSLQQVLQAIEWPALRRAIESDDDVLIAAAFDDELFQGVSVLEEDVKDRVELARTRVQWLVEVRLALRRRNAGELRELLIDPPPGAPERLSAPERRRIRRSIERRRALAELDSAIREDDDAAIVVSLNRVERVGARISDRATWARVQQVVEQVSLIDDLLEAAEAQPLDYARISQLIPAIRALGLEHDPRLGGDDLVERLETEVIRMAHVRRIRAAISRDNDIAIVAAAVPDPRGALDLLHESERDRVAAAILARRREERTVRRADG